MENGYGERLADRFSGMRMNDSFRSPDDDAKTDGLFQVMEAVEAAEATIKQQLEENNHLRNELQKKIRELEKYKSDESLVRRPDLGDQSNASVHGPYEVHQSVSGSGLDARVKSTDKASAVDRSGTLVVHQHLQSDAENATTDIRARNQSAISMINGAVRGPAVSAGLYQFSSPSTTSMSPLSHPIDGEHGQHSNLSVQGLMPVAKENNSNSLWKQDLIHKIREQEEEILQLRKHLTDYSVKEAQIRNEKYVLEKRIAYMRLAFDQQQQDLVDAASKALSYRQEIIEENIRLTYALQAAQQERSTFVSSLMPLLAEYSLQPQVSDAQSIVSNLKVLFRHLQEKLLLTESKLKESEYQLAPWNSETNPSNMLPAHSVGAGLKTTDNNALELVSQPPYSHGQAATDWDLLHRHQVGPDGPLGKNLESDEPGRYLPLSSRNHQAHEMPEQLSRDEAHGTRQREASKQVKFREPLSSREMDDVDAERESNAREPPFDDPSTSSSPYLPPVLEEPLSSFSEAADDDPLPAIEGLQISGEAFPGRELQACGYSVNGTMSCNFEWVRHLEDGSVNYIEGAKQPNYLVTADDVDTYLAIEVQPLDERKRKGELVKVFANENQKITCGSEMQSHIEKTIHTGHASYKVSFATVYFDKWESATLSIKREGYSIKRSSGLAVTEKFSPSTTVTIPYGQPGEFVITGSDGTQYLLRTDNVATDVSCSRDAIVLTLRLFIIRAIERRKGKKKGFLFNK